MPSLFVLTSPYHAPSPRTVTKWTDAVARLERMGVTVAFGGTSPGAGPRLQETTPLGTEREAIDMADLVVIDGNGDVATALWAMARRGSARLPLIVVEGALNDLLTPDMWPADAGDLLQRTARDGVWAAVDHALGTTLARGARPALDAAPLPAPVMSTPMAHRGFGSHDLALDVDLVDVRDRLDPSVNGGRDLPPGRIGASHLADIVKQAIALAIATRDEAMLANAVALGADGVEGDSPLTRRALGGRTLAAKWILYHLAMYCPEEMLEELPVGLLERLWTAALLQRHGSMLSLAGAELRGGRLLASSRAMPQAENTEWRREVEVAQQHAVDLSGASHCDLYEARRMGHTEHGIDAIALAALGAIRTPDITQLDESTVAGLANPFYWIATGRARGLAHVVREVAGMVPNSTWSNRRIQGALCAAVEMLPPGDANEMAEWEDILRSTRSKNLQKTLATGMSAWPTHSRGVTEILHQHIRQVTIGVFTEDKARHLARRTLDPQWRTQLAAEANAMQGARMEEEGRRRREFDRLLNGGQNNWRQAPPNF